jgi:large subunit ribosomal protein L2
MPTRKFKPITPSRRHMELPDFSELTKKKPEESLLEPLSKTGGRNNQGRVTVRHRGGGHKRLYRIIDFARDKWGVPARVVSKEYDPNRSAWITLLHYADGEKRYILSPVNLEIGSVIEAGENIEARVGNALPLKKIPVGAMVHCVEFTPRSRGKLARAAGTACQVMAVEGGYARLRLPSGEIRLFHEDCMATVGQVGNIDHKNVVHGKAGRVRHLGIRPTVRGTAMNPVDHPHGGGEGRHYVGGPPRTFSGKPAKGVRTRKPNKPSDRWIVSRRKGGKV